MGEFVNLEASRVDRVGIIRIDRPKVNALNPQLSQELLAVANEAEDRDDLGALVLWGGPKIFAAGADIGSFPVNDGDRDPANMVDDLVAALSKIENLPQITCSAVNGFALGGGCEVAMSTDFRVCGESARFGLPEILLGIIPGAGGTQRLTRLVGVTKSKEICYSGRMVEAEEALAIGLVSSVHPDDQVLDAAIDLLAPYASGAAALVNLKRAIMDGLHLDLEQAIAVERREFVAAFQSDDAVIGLTSFVENGPGKAKFTGK